jgi:putative Mn2+ efflux pump MntP
MGLDIKLPIGLMFSIFGVLLTIYGIATSGDVMYTKSLNININVWSGILMIVFGLAMLIPALMQRKKRKPTNEA